MGGRDVSESVVDGLAGLCIRVVVELAAKLDEGAQVLWRRRSRMVQRERGLVVLVMLVMVLVVVLEVTVRRRGAVGSRVERARGRWRRCSTDR
jgi:hypothetical protein